MRARADFRDEPQGYARTLAHPAGGFFNQLDLVDGIHVDGVNPCADGLIYFGVRLARAVEDELPGLETGAQGLEELAAAIDLGINPGVEHGLEDGHVGVGFRGVEETDRAVNGGGRALESFDVRADARLGEDEERCIVRLDERERVRAADRQVAVARLKITGNRPCRSRSDELRGH